MTRGVVIALVAMLVLGSCDSSSHSAKSVPATNDAPDRSSPWPEAMHDARHSGTSLVVGPQTGAVRWSRDLGGDATPGPVIGSDGSVITATDAGVLYSLDPEDGSTRWTFDGGSGYGNDLSTSAAVLADGTIVWPGPGGSLYGFTPTGRVLWNLDLGGFVLSPAVASSGRIYAATMSGELDAIDIVDSQPSIVWTLDYGGVSYGSPAIAADGTILVTGSDRLVAVTDRGTSSSRRWTYTVEDTIEVSPAISADGIVVIGTNARTQYGIDVATGQLRWTTTRKQETYSSPTISPDGLARYGDHSATLYVVDTHTGVVVRSTTTRADTPGRSAGIWTAPAVDFIGDAYYGTRSGHVFGLGPDGTVLFDREVGGTVASYPAIGGDGSLYIGSSNGTLTAFGPG